jgi:tetratricopeptide (TPR) repeat protein
LCLYEQVKYDKAVDWYNRALISKGYNIDDSDKAQILLDYNKEGFLGNTDAAVFDVNSNDIFFNRGLAYYSEGKIKKAYRDFEGRIESGFYMKSSYRMIGLCWLTSGERDHACEAFHKAIFYGDSLSIMELSKIGCK